MQFEHFTIKWHLAPLMDDYSTSVFIDNGSGACKAGFAGEPLPRAIIPSVVGSAGYLLELRHEMGLKELYVGTEAQERRGILEMAYPIRRGVVTNWEDMETIWYHMFYNALNISPDQYPVLLSENPFNPSANREMMTQIMFETFNVPSMYVAVQALMSLYGTGRISGVVLDSGDGVTYAVPIYRGSIVRRATNRLKLAGSDITRLLRKLLNQNGFSFTAEDDEQIRMIKEKLCFTALDYTQELGAAYTSRNRIEISHEFSDGQVIVVGDERFRCTEALFDPFLMGIDLPGIHEILHDSITKCRPEIQNCMYANVVLSGGNTLFPGLVDRLQKEISTRAPPTSSIGIFARPDRKHNVWFGGSILGSLDSFRKEWISKEDYNEYGPSVVHIKCKMGN